MNEQTSTPQKLKAPQNQRSELDLTIGNPIFMQEYWDTVAKYYNGAMGMLKMHPNERMSYNYAQNNEKLKHAIADVHKQCGNAETSGYAIILGNGASQLVAAAAYAMSDVAPHITYNTPCWPRIKFLLRHGIAANSHMILPRVSQYIEGDSCELVVKPNNPDNSINERPYGMGIKWKIHDLCYNWPQYSKVYKAAEQIMIFGLAKATGHAGTRLGWALVKNPEVAGKMRQYVELTTSGVSEEAQQRAYIVLDTTLRLQKDSFTSCFDYAKHELDGRWSAISKLATKNKFTITNNSGMFAWCKLDDGVTADEIEKELGLKVLRGEAFGDQFTNYFRLSMGSATSTFAALVGRMS
jgi:L-tryptophan--pyruvate aminotransferase